MSRSDLAAGERATSIVAALLIGGALVGLWGVIERDRYLGSVDDRVGAECVDGTRSDATGRGACSGHGGVEWWLEIGPSADGERLTEIRVATPGWWRWGGPVDGLIEYWVPIGVAGLLVWWFGKDSIDNRRRLELRAAAKEQRIAELRALYSSDDD